MKAIIFLLMFIGLIAEGSTFVGNGGGQGDVELAVTKKQIVQTLGVIKQSTGELCVCNSAYRNRSVCDALASLSAAEAKYCTTVLRKQAPALLGLIQDNSGVIFRWTNSNIEVSEQGVNRPVDAVTNREKKEIILNLDRFLSMKPYDRVFLVIHELSHLSSLEGKPLADEGAVGAFEGTDGGRRLLNSMGSAAAILQANYPKEISGYRAALRRSQSSKSMWVELNFGRAKFAKENKETFAAEKYERGQIILRYNFGDFGILGSHRYEDSERKELDTINVRERKNILSLGVSYRFFPFSEPLTYWGQSHLQLQAMVDFVNADIRLREDPAPDLKEKKSSIGGNISMNYYFPFFWGIWPYIGVAYEYHPYKYSSLNVNYRNDIISGYMGGAYAF